MAPETRSAGVLLHPTSLPSLYGIGDFGAAAYHWIDALVEARQSWWQILPLNPVGYGNSPYQSFASSAGNFYLVSPDLMVQDGLLRADEINQPAFSLDTVDFQAVTTFKDRLFIKAWTNFQNGAAGHLRAGFEEFQHQQHYWLDDYACFRAIKDLQGGKAWYEWPTKLVKRESSAMSEIRSQHGKEIGYYQFVQYLFFKQWWAVRHYANERGIRIFGDVPIFVAADSADVWGNPEIFQLDENHRPRVVAGVPPDYFSATGQLWGNPLYDWEALAKSDYKWWVDRLRAMLQLVDMVRIDHFRGFEAYWEVPAGNPTAEIGQWVKAPGVELFQKLEKALGQLPVVAEDLGIITPEVDALRHQFEFPGMRVLQFAFGGGGDNPYLPHNYDQNTVVYTGTHDNNTTRGWYDHAPEKEKDHVRRYAAISGSDISWDMIRMAWASTGYIAIAPLQDILDLDSSARMNFPGKADGNWAWRFQQEMLTPEHLNRLAELTELYGRC